MENCVRQSSMSDQVLVGQKDHIAYVTLNRPERLNALGQDVGKGLIDAFMKVVGEVNDLARAKGFDQLSSNDRFAAGQEVEFRSVIGF